MVWVEPVATTKLLGYPHYPHQREFCTEGLLGRHALGMLEKTLINLFYFIVSAVIHPQVPLPSPVTVKAEKKAPSRRLSEEVSRSMRETKTVGESSSSGSGSRARGSDVMLMSPEGSSKVESRPLADPGGGMDTPVSSSSLKGE